MESTEGKRKCFQCGRESAPEILICKNCGAVLTKETNQGEEHAHQGELHAQEGKIPAAVEEYRKAIQLLPSRADLHYRLGLLYERQSECETTTFFSDLTLGEFRQALRLEPTESNYHLKFINLCLKRDLLVEAAQEFRSLRERFPACQEIETSLKKINALSQFRFSPSTVATPRRGRVLNLRIFFGSVILGEFFYGVFTNQPVHLIIGVLLFLGLIIYQGRSLRKLG